MEAINNALYVAWDGGSAGTDGNIWGGDFLLTRPGSFARIGYFRPFRVPGIEAASRHPARAALGMLYAALGDTIFDYWPERLGFTMKQIAGFRRMLTDGLNSPWTTSVGKMFDAVAAITGCCTFISFEGEAALQLEAVAAKSITERYPFSIDTGEKATIVDWRPMLKQLLTDVASNRPVSVVAAVFQNTLASIVLSMATRVGEPDVVLTGSCFQNRTLANLASQQLQAAGFNPSAVLPVLPVSPAVALAKAGLNP